MQPSTTAGTLHSRFIFHTIANRLDPCISKLPGDVRYLEFAVKDLRIRCFTLVMRVLPQAKEQTQLPATSTITLKTTAWVRNMPSSTLTIAKDRIQNNAVLGCAVWRTLTGGHKTIQYSLMLTGHTKFSCDWHFGVWKNRWRHMDA
ncbi:uncharacterized protein LOC128235640 [Mya arenaria]|uniref:uncharacterized protein LOC128235640 n=1 Tax=Mya arenaria TaxID=6604 RepID=UPI0022E7FDE2|nr:uncharacterized protein LOC128235640 [Mya arenaria]